jgi:hypothetical protein
MAADKRGGRLGVSKVRSFTSTDISRRDRTKVAKHPAAAHPPITNHQSPVRRAQRLPVSSLSRSSGQSSHFSLGLRFAPIRRLPGGCRTNLFSALRASTRLRTINPSLQYSVTPLLHLSPPLRPAKNAMFSALNAAFVASIDSMRSTLFFGPMIGKTGNGWLSK